MRCFVCGKRRSSGTKYCGNCGINLNNIEILSQARLDGVVKTISVSAIVTVLGSLFLLIIFVLALILLKADFAFIFLMAVFFVASAIIISLLFVYELARVLKAFAPKSDSKHILEKQNPAELEAPKKPLFSITEATTLILKSNPNKKDSK